MTHTSSGPRQTTIFTPSCLARSAMCETTRTNGSRINEQRKEQEDKSGKGNQIIVPRTALAVAATNNPTKTKNAIIAPASFFGRKRTCVASSASNHDASVTQSAALAGEALPSLMR